MSDEYMVDYFPTLIEAETKFPNKNIEILTKEEYNEVNEKYLLVQKNRFCEGENITHL